MGVRGGICYPRATVVASELQPGSREYEFWVGVAGGHKRAGVVGWSNGLDYEAGLAGWSGGLE